MRWRELKIGQTWSFEVEVTPEMKAAFEDNEVHDLYGTAAMLTHMEWASRQHILPALEEGEEGVGYYMSIEHRSPTPIGGQVRVSAKVIGVTHHQVICECQAWSDGRMVGRAKVIQAILPLARLHAKLPKHVISKTMSS